MAASAVSLLDCVGVQPRRERLGAFSCKSHILQTRRFALLSALSDLQRVKAAPEWPDHSVSEGPVKLDSSKARSKGRTKKASALPHETQGNHDSVSSRKNFNGTSLGFSLVRSVVNAEDSSNEDRNGAASTDITLSVNLEAGKEKQGENSAVLQQDKSGVGKSTSLVNADIIPKKKLAKRIVPPTPAAQIEPLDDYTSGVMAYADNSTIAFHGMNTGSNNSCQENQNRASFEHIAVSSSRKARRRKSEEEVIVQDCRPSVSVLGLSDSITACKKPSGTGHTQEHCSTDDHRNNEHAWQEPSSNVCIKPVKLKYDAKLGEDAFERSRSLDSLPTHSSSPFHTEELVNEGSKPSGRKKKCRNFHLKQRVSKRVDKIEGSGNANMSEFRSDVGKLTKVLDKSTLTNQSSKLEDGLPEQQMKVKLSVKNSSRYFKQVQQSELEASDVGEGAHTDRTTDAQFMVDKKLANDLQNSRITVTGLTAVCGPDFEGSLQKEGSKALRNSRRTKRPQKQQSSEDINVVGDACKVSKHNQGMFTVQWLVETHLDENQKLYLAGESSYLGGWEPSMAVSFTPCDEAEKANLWQAYCQVPYGTRSEYNYFVQVGDKVTGPRVWRPGSKLLLAVPPENSPETEMTINDLLDFNVANKLPALLWEGLQNEIGFPAELRRFFGDEVGFESLKQSKLVKVEDELSKNIPKQREPPDILEQKEDCMHVVLEDVVKDVTLPRPIDDTALLTKPESDDNLYPIKLTPKLKKLIRKRVFPREEPWLMESMILYEKGDMPKPLTASVTETGQEAADSQDAIVEKNSGKGEVLTEILINSSKSTMERIAILENGKLVELLLKPLNSDINVGNVYLGIVKKLLPGMTGVFVDIGHPRVALLSITKNVYPFTFPPIASNDKPSNSYILDADGHLSGEQGVSSVELGQDLQKCDDLVDDDWETEDEDGEEDEVSEVIDDDEELAGTDTHSDVSHGGNLSEKLRGRKLLLVNEKITRPITVNFGQRFTKWRKVEEGMRIIVQVKREPLGKKGPKVCAFPQLASRFWVLGMGGKSTAVSKKIHGPERRRLKDLANLFQKPGFDLTVRTEATGQSQEDLEKDLMRLLETWKDIMAQAETASFSAQNGQDGAVPTLLHRAMGQTLSIVRDFFAEKVQRMVVDSAQTYHEVTSYLQEVAPQLQNRVELYTGTSPIFDVFNLEDDIDRLLNERVQLPNGAYLVIEETEALVTIDVNGGAGMLGKSMKSAAILEANLAAARQIAAELRLRDIGGIIVIDFIDMDEDEHESLVYEEIRNAIQSDRSIIYFSEISELGLMELTRRRVRPSVTFMISEPCTCCRGTGRVEALETTFSKIERAILRLVANHSENIHFDGRTWKKVLLRVDPVMFEFLTRKQRAAQLSSCLKVYIILKVGREMSRGSFELSELKLESEKRSSAGGGGGGQQPRSLRKAVRMGGAGGTTKDLRL